MDKEGFTTINCPLCNSQESVDLDRYPGSFFSCERLAQCSHCGLIWAVPLPSISDLDEYYSSGLYYDIESDPYNVSFKEWSLNLARTRLDLILSVADLAETSRVLDIGGGNGLFGQALMEYSRYIEYDVVEPDEAIRAKHGSQVRESYKDLNSVKKDYYDLIVLNQVVEHVPDPTNFVKTTCTALRPGGYIFVDVPNRDHLYKPNVEPHILFWGKEPMSMLFDQIGLKMIFCNTVGMPVSQAARFFARPRPGKLDRLLDFWFYHDLLNRALGMVNLKIKLDTFRRFQANSYGGERQWLRAIGQKIA